jgi:hypothetical protein
LCVLRLISRPDSTPPALGFSWNIQNTLLMKTSWSLHVGWKVGCFNTPTTPF